MRAYTSYGILPRVLAQHTVITIRISLVMVMIDLPVVIIVINKSAEERYSALLNNNKEIFKYAQLKHIASYLGVTDTSLGRIRNEFSKKG